MLFRRAQKVAPYGFMRGNQDAEYSKYLSSILRTPKRAMILDNCTGEIDSEILSALIFSSIHTSRILGTNTVSGKYRPDILCRNR